MPRDVAEGGEVFGVRDAPEGAAAQLPTHRDVVQSAGAARATGVPSPTPMLTATATAVPVLRRPLTASEPGRRTTR